MLCPAHEILAQGIALGGLRAFLGSETGLSYAASCASFLRVPLGGALWAPYRSLPILLAVPKLESDELSGKKGAERNDLTHTLVATVPMESWAQELSAPAWTAILTQNSLHLEALPFKRAGASRHSFFTAFAAACKVT